MTTSITNFNAVPSNNKVDLSWSAPTNTTNFAYYQYRWRTSSTPGSVSVTYPYIDTASTSVSVNNLLNGTSYDFQVRAVYSTNGVLSSGPINSIFGVVPNGPVPPTSVALSDAGIVTFVANSAAAEGATYFYNLDNSDNYIGPVSSPFQIPIWKPDTNYAVYMYARKLDEYSVSVQSNTVTTPTIQDLITAGVSPWELLNNGNTPDDFPDAAQLLQTLISDETIGTLPNLLPFFDRNVLRRTGAFTTTQFIESSIDVLTLVPNPPIILPSTTPNTIKFQIVVDGSPFPTGIKLIRGGSVVGVYSMSELSALDVDNNIYQIDL